MVHVVLPNMKGREALEESLRRALKLKKELGITFNRDANDVYEGLLGVLMGVEVILEEYRKFTGIRDVIRDVAKKKGKKLEDGVYITTKDLKGAAEEVGVDWNELKELLKEMDVIDYDTKRKKYKVKGIT